jgi:hypothetical protein
MAAGSAGAQWECAELLVPSLTAVSRAAAGWRERAGAEDVVVEIGGGLEEGEEEEEEEALWGRLGESARELLGALRAEES